MKKRLLDSILIHVTLILALLQWQNPEWLKPAREIKPIEFTRLDPPQLLKAQSGRPDRLSIKSLGLQGRPMSGSGPAHAGREATPDGFEIANGMDVAKESKLYPFFKALWSKINASTAYPSDFVKQRITGSVTVQLMVDRKGVFTGRFLRSEADDLYLKTYILVTLAHALKTPLPRKLWTDQDRMVLVTQFDFSVFTVGHVLRSQEREHDKNLFFFTREAYANPKLNDVIEKLYSRYLPPIIPVPGGAFIDFVHAYEMVQNMGKSDEDDLRQARLEHMKSQWDHLILGSNSQSN